MQSLRIGIVKGRTYAPAVNFLKNKLNLNPTLYKENSRCLQFKPETFELAVGSERKMFQIIYTLISPRDVGDYLEKKLLDLVIGYDDTLHHIRKKNYSLKPLFANNESGDARLCLVGRPDSKISNHMNIICSEYTDATTQQSSFDVFENVKGTWCESHGCAESMVVNGLADFCVVVVQTGETLDANGLVVHKEVRKLYLNALVNTDNALGRLLISSYRPDIRHVVIDGIDGCGKTTLIEYLRNQRDLKNYIFYDRGDLTKLTLLERKDWPKTLSETHVVLDINPQIAKRRISYRSKVVDKWEDIQALSYFRFKYRELVAHYGLFMIDSDCSVESIYKRLTAFLSGSIRPDCPRMCDLTDEQVATLPLIAQGESKIIRGWNALYDIVQYIPSIYSHKKKRAGFIEGSERERMQMTNSILHILAYEQIPHTYLYVGERFILAEKLQSAPPKIEVVVKSCFCGTDKYRYPGLELLKSRITGDNIVKNDKYDSPYVRFDWRNDNSHTEGDVAMADEMADELIDTNCARELAIRTFIVLNKHFNRTGISMWDFCLFITAEGDRIFGEISQDNGRYRRLEDGQSLDKDLWRSGGSSDDILEKWKLLTKVVGTYVSDFFRGLYV